MHRLAWLLPLLLSCGDRVPSLAPLSASDPMLVKAMAVAEDLMGESVKDEIKSQKIRVWFMSEAQGFYDFCGKKWIEGEDRGDGVPAPYTGPALDGCNKGQSSRIFVFNWEGERSNQYECGVMGHELIHAIGHHRFKDSDPGHKKYPWNKVFQNGGCF